jgi:hypothetical protein
MFVTKPQFEQYVPAPIAPPDSRFWRAIDLSLPTPWYLCVYRVNGELPSKTILVAWEADLLHFVNAQGRSSVSAVARLEMSVQSARWTMRWVESIWLSASDEQEEVGPLVFQLEGDEEPRDDHMRALPSRNDRVRIFNISDAIS